MYSIHYRNQLGQVCQPQILDHRCMYCCTPPPSGPTITTAGQPAPTPTTITPQQWCKNSVRQWIDANKDKAQCLRAGDIRDLENICAAAYITKTLPTSQVSARLDAVAYNACARLNPPPTAAPPPPSAPPPIVPPVPPVPPPQMTMPPPATPPVTVPPTPGGGIPQSPPVHDVPFDNGGGGGPPGGQPKDDSMVRKWGPIVSALLVVAGGSYLLRSKKKRRR